jgi:hypothetical protein
VGGPRQAHRRARNGAQEEGRPTSQGRDPRAQGQPPGGPCRGRLPRHEEAPSRPPPLPPGRSRCSSSSPRASAAAGSPPPSGPRGLPGTTGRVAVALARRSPPPPAAAAATTRRRGGRPRAAARGAQAPRVRVGGAGVGSRGVPRTPLRRTAHRTAGGLHKPAAHPRPHTHGRTFQQSTQLTAGFFHRTAHPPNDSPPLCPQPPILS